MKITKTKKKIIIILLAVVLIIAGFSIFKPKKSPYEFAQVERKDLEQIVSASGTVKPSQEINLQFETTGKIRNIFVKVGDKVKVGQTLIKLDNADLQIQYRQEQAAVEAAKAKLDLLKAGSSQEEIKLAETEVKNYETNLANVENKAESDLNILYDAVKETLNDAYLKADAMYYKQTSNLFDSSNRLTFSTQATQAQIDAEGKRPNIKADIIQMNSYLSETQSLVTQTRLDELLNIFKTKLEAMRDFLNDVAESLNNSIGISSTNLTTYKTDLDTARTNINTAISNILDDQQDIATQKITNQTNVDTAKANLAKAQDQLLIKKTGSRPEDIRYQEALIRQQEAALAGIAEKIRKTSLIAPVEGIITKIDAEIGETILTTQIPLAMNSVGNFEIELDISETDISKALIGQPAKITLDAFLDEEFSGHVVKIEPAQTVIQGVVYYKSTISFDNQDERIRAGMTANVDIITAEKENVLTIPLRSVTKKDGTDTVKILENRQLKEIEIQIGLVGSSGEIEVISGLTEGQQIISFIKQK